MADRRSAAALPAPRAGRRPHGVRRLSRLVVPERLAGAVDAHAHLQHPAFDADRAAVIERARAAGLVRLLVPGYDRVSSERAVELAAAHPDLIDAAVGIHPHHAAAAAEDDWQKIEALAGESRTVAVGEIGLDFFRNLSPPDAQREAFARQLDLARRVAKPVIVHDRDAHAAVTSALLAWGPRSGLVERGILHCFSGDAPMAAALAAAGFVISFALPVSFSSSRGPRQAAVELPGDRILVETDAPWLSVDGGRNEPTTVLRVAAAVGRLRGEEPDVVALAAAATYRRVVS